MARRIYMDYASLTPIDKKVAKEMIGYFNLNAGNPSALYLEGVLAKKVVKDSRTKIAGYLNVRTEEIFFTASGTESDNMAILGVYNAWKDKFTPHIITTTIEHPGILEVCRHIEKEGGEVSYIAPEENGIVSPQKIAEALKQNTVLVSIMYANNEIGTIQPLREVSRMVTDYRKSKHSLIPYFHTDASQAANYLDLSFQKLGIDIMTLDGAKMYGPRGSGILAVKKYVAIKPIIFGGGQERGLRSGTENVPSIAGLARALSLVQGIRDKESARLTELRDYFFDGVIKHIPNVIINGDREKRLPNNINICIPELDAEFAVIKMDTEGVSCSAASSCQSLSEEPYSYVIHELGEQGGKCRGSSLRFTLGQGTTRKDIDLTLRKILSIITIQ